MCIFHDSPDGFFWADRREYFILLDRYVFDYSQQLLMCIFSSFSGWILLSSPWVSHSLGSLFFRFATLIPNVLTFMFVEWWMDVISVKWVSIQILQYRWLPWIIMKTFCVFAVLYGGKYLICPIDSLLAAMLIWMFLSFLFESCFALLTYFFLRCWRGYMVFLFFLNHDVNITGMEWSRKWVFFICPFDSFLAAMLMLMELTWVDDVFLILFLNHAANIVPMEWSRR